MVQLLFFAFLGFDAVAMASEEVKNPQKDVPRGIIGSILIATVLYIIVTLILTGIVPYTELGVNDPVAFAMRYVGHGTVGAVIAVGAILTLLTVTISMMYSLARLLFAVSKDGLLPKFMTEIDQKHRTPKSDLCRWCGSHILCRIFPIECISGTNEYHGACLFDAS